MKTVPLQDVLAMLERIEHLAEAHEAAWQLRSGTAARMAQNGFGAVATECHNTARELKSGRD